MKIWIDDVREAPEGYVHIHSVDEAKECIIFAEEQYAKRNTVMYYCGHYQIELIDIDHDAGDAVLDMGGDQAAELGDQVF